MQVSKVVCVYQKDNYGENSVYAATFTDPKTGLSKSKSWNNYFYSGDSWALLALQQLPQGFLTEDGQAKKEEFCTILWGPELAKEYASIPIGSFGLRVA